MAGGAAVVVAELCRRASSPLGCEGAWKAGTGGAAVAVELVKVSVVASSVRAGLPGGGGAVSTSRSTVTISEGPRQTGHARSERRRARPGLAFLTGGSSRVHATEGSGSRP